MNRACCPCAREECCRIFRRTTAKFEVNKAATWNAIIQDTKHGKLRYGQ